MLSHSTCIHVRIKATRVGTSLICNPYSFCILMLPTRNLFYPSCTRSHFVTRCCRWDHIILRSPVFIATPKAPSLFSMTLNNIILHPRFPTNFSSVLGKESRYNVPLASHVDVRLVDAHCPHPLGWTAASWRARLRRLLPADQRALSGPGLIQVAGLCLTDVIGILIQEQTAIAIARVIDNSKRSFIMHQPALCGPRPNVCSPGATSPRCRD
ncbi:hypothetical protein OF83DRAFT_870237 [Amylostereum chailletii]|nr:hypothetical protein OF83DRAFT_870237 [Amylostereum chailletii]